MRTLVVFLCVRLISLKVSSQSTSLSQHWLIPLSMFLSLLLSFKIQLRHRCFLRNSIEIFGLESGPSSVLLSQAMHQHDLFTTLFPYQMMHSLRARAEFTYQYMLCITPNRLEARVDRCLINIYWVNKGCSFPMFFFPNLYISLPLFSLLFPHQNQPNMALYCETRI